MGRRQRPPMDPMADIMEERERQEAEEDPDIGDLNNPDVESLAEPPLLGSRPRASEQFGDEAENFGRATSPKLYASTSQFPSAIQFRVWRWENGVPVGLGSIDAEATEEDFVTAFFAAMPKPGEGKFQFRLRPIDIRGQELGKEFTINISEHHSTLQRKREAMLREREEREGHNGGGGRGDVIVTGNDAAGASYAEEMGRMFEQAVETAERRTELLQNTLEEERARLRQEEKQRVDERIGLAERSAGVVEKMTEKLMASDRARADEAIKAQREHGGVLLSTLTTVFQQQQEASRQQAERIREADAHRMAQDREFFERQRQEVELRRASERDEEARLRQREREEWERKRESERAEAAAKIAAEKADSERKREEEQARLTLESRRIEEQRKYEIEQLRLETQRREAEADRRREAEKEELRARLERDRLEAERLKSEAVAKREEDQSRLALEARRIEEQRKYEIEQLRMETQRREADAERRRDLEKEELRRQQDSAREERERWRVELEEKRRAETADWERKQSAERDERERRERNERERWEREKLELQQRMEAARLEFDRKESQRREDMAREDAKRREDIALQQKALELTAQKDREHSERMMELARLEREAQREAASQREKAEREAREAQERERQRQHELTAKEMELSKERDREHAERMLQLSKAQHAGGLGGITEMLGMETPELLSRIFGGGGGEGEEGKGGWADMIPKVLGAVAEMGKVAMAAQAARPQERPALPQQQPQQIIIQTPQGPRLVPAASLAGMNLQPPPQPGRRPVPVAPAADLPDESFQPPAPSRSDVVEEVSPAPSVPTAPKEAEPEKAVEKSEDYRLAEGVNFVRRAKHEELTLLQQKKARRTLRDLVVKLDKSPEADWTGITTEAIAKNLDTYHYIKGVTIYGALVEAKASPDLCERIVSSLKASGLIPEDVPYNEADYAKREQEREAARVQVAEAAKKVEAKTDKTEDLKKEAK